MTSRDAVLAANVEAKPIEWLWRDRLPKGMLAVVAGRRDQGKSLFATHVAAEVSARGGNVLYSAMEDDPARMTKPRLAAAGADLSRVLLWRFRLPYMFDQLAARITESDIRLCVIDPFASHLSGGVSRGSDSVREVTDPLAELAEATGCTFLIIEHMLKKVSQYADPGDAIAGGSSGLASAARAAYLFGMDPKDGDRRLLCPVKLNIGGWPQALSFETDVIEADTGTVPYLLPQGETEAAASVLFASGRNKQPGRPPDKRAAAAEWLTRYLFNAGKPVKAGTVMEDAKQHALSTNTLRRAADDMGIVRQPPAGGRNCTWELPAEVTAALKAAESGAAS